MTAEQYLTPEEAAFKSNAFPRYVKNSGTAFVVTGLAYSETTEIAFWKFSPAGYTGGNITCDVVWYADTSVTAAHGVAWQVALAAITPSVDTQNVETKAFATSQTGTTDLGSTDAQKLMVTTIVITNLDSIAAGDEAWLSLTRLPGNAADDLTGDAIVTSVRLSYSDT
ncbi:hypothetical protein ACIBQX_18825 [Nonomuraea sp. NPDC049714]|uniref:hypothetical protein n=1 Tax=Nonomuraea sp. NPDC049714 TaxID=3364357 RepID=UPI003794D92A